MAGGRLSRFFKTVGTVLWFPLTILVFWWVASIAFTNPFFVQPQEIAGVMATLLEGPFLELYFFPTLTLVTGGYVLGASSGVILGTLVGSHARTLEILGPLIVFFRNLPSAARVSVLLAIFGLGTQSLVLTVALSSTFHVAMMTMGGVARVSKITLETARMLRLSLIRQIFQVRIPGAAGEILTSLQTSLQGSILVAVLVETLASGRGMGTFTTEALGLMRVSHLWISVLVLGALGLVLNEVFHQVERRLAPWYFKTRTQRGKS